MLATKNGNLLGSEIFPPGNARWKWGKHWLMPFVVIASMHLMYIANRVSDRILPGDSWMTYPRFLAFTVIFWLLVFVSFMKLDQALITRGYSCDYGRFPSLAWFNLKNILIFHAVLIFVTLVILLVCDNNRHYEIGLYVGVQITLAITLFIDVINQVRQQKSKPVA